MGNALDTTSCLICVIILMGYNRDVKEAELFKQFFHLFVQLSFIILFKPYLND